MKETLVIKAWKINVKNLLEPWNHDDIVVLSDTREEARSKGLSELIYQGATKDVYYLEDNTLNYIDIIAIRYKRSDRILFEGKEIKRDDLDKYLWQNERDEEARLLTISNPDDLAVVYAGCYGQYWGANRSGYSSSIVFAGKYTTKEAYDIVRGSSYSRHERVKLLDVEEFNKDLNEQISKKQIEMLNSYKI